MTVFLLLTACATHAPAELPGWSWAAPSTAPESTLWLAVTGRGRSAARLSYPDGGSELLDFTGYAYVLEHPEQGLVVVDPGYPRLAQDPMAYPGEFMAEATGLYDVTPLADQLDALGFEPSQVKHLLITHGHADHAGAIADFPQATLHVLEAEWDFARTESKLHAVVPGPYLEHAQVDLVELSGGPYGPFPRHLDLFEDGSVIVLPTPGHTPAHSSVLLNTPQGSFLVVGDAAWHERNWAEPVPKGALSRALLEDDPKAAWLALLRVNAWKQAHPELHVMAGHEVTLEQRYELLPRPLEARE